MGRDQLTAKWVLPVTSVMTMTSHQKLAGHDRTTLTGMGFPGWSTLDIALQFIMVIIGLASGKCYHLRDMCHWQYTCLHWGFMAAAFFFFFENNWLIEMYNGFYIYWYSIMLYILHYVMRLQCWGLAQYFKITQAFGLTLIKWGWWGLRALS